MATPTEITLANLGGGDLLELATIELRKICENIADPNVKKDAKRKLTISIEIKPDAKGGMATIAYGAKTTMPGPDAGHTVAYIGMGSGSKTITLFEVAKEPNQPLPFEEDLPGVTPLAKKQA